MIFLQSLVSSFHLLCMYYRYEVNASGETLQNFLFPSAVKPICLPMLPLVWHPAIKERLDLTQSNTEVYSSAQSRKWITQYAFN